MSKTTAVARARASMASLFLKSTPSPAARPVATITAAGVASPSAQGQAIKSTARALAKAKESRGSGPRVIQRAKARRATTTTTGTKTAAMRSASCWMGGLPAWAASTSRMIWAR